MPRARARGIAHFVCPPAHSSLAAGSIRFIAASSPVGAAVYRRCSAGTTAGTATVYVHMSKPARQRAQARPPSKVRAAKRRGAVVAVRFVRMARKVKHARRRSRKARRRTALASGAVSLGSLAVGALALGAVAIGVLAIRRLAIKRAAIGRLDVGELKVGRLEVDELVVRTRS